MKDNKRILVIDDEEGIRKLFQGIFIHEQKSNPMQKGMQLFNASTEKLETENRALPTTTIEYQLALAENGAKGIELVKTALSNNLPFAVAFIDMKMPGLNGAETLKQIWEIDPEIKIVIVTAFSEYSSADIVESTGRDDIFYLRKPFSHDEIIQFARALTVEWNLEKKRDFLELKLQAANDKLEEINKDLKGKVEKQAALIVQAEKMASVGVLAAGIAHEINNPIAFISSNLFVVKNYFKGINDLFRKYSDLETSIEQDGKKAIIKQLNDIKAFKKENDINMIIKDLNELADESIEGVQRVKNIVKDLKNFSRIDETEYRYLDINNSIDTTLNIIWNELKYKATIEKQYSDFPEIKCFPQKISQVFMNLLINAGQAISEKGIIKISTKLIKQGQRETDKFVEIKISDS
ncbi:MAG: response regulator, partial [Desulfobacteraceae bacterium]|nr:response regulator [Desulfobacteraceae bacterium]